MIWPLRGRREFVQLERSGRRYPGPFMTIMFAPDVNATPPRVAYSVGKQVGTAVVRNRVRRRLRAAVRSCDRRHPLVPGRYLIVARPAITEIDFPTLEADLCTRLPGVES